MCVCVETEKRVAGCGVEPVSRCGGAGGGGVVCARVCAWQRCKFQRQFSHRGILKDRRGGGGSKKKKSGGVGFEPGSGTEMVAAATFRS